MKRGISPSGGALAKMLPILHEEISGPVNAVAPRAVSNREFTEILGKVLSRPVFFPVPAFGVKVLFGEMGQKLLLEGARVIPRRLTENGYCFLFPDLRMVLDQVLPRQQKANP